MLQKLFLLSLGGGEIFYKMLLISLAFLIKELVHAAHSVFYAVIFALAHAVFCNVNELIFYSAFLEIALRFLCIKAL